MIRVDDLTVRYGPSTVLHSVSFAVAQGESFALVGESGSGKSTILKALAGQVDDWSGQMAVGGQPVTRSRSRAQAAQVQMVFQDPYGSLHPRRTVDDALSEPLAIHGLPDRDARVLAMLDAVGLARRFRFRLPHQLSGGQRQRVAIARALMLSPKVLLLDEPTSALDPELVGEVLRVMKLLAEEGRTMLVVTHEMGFAREVSNHLIFLHKGCIEEQGVPAEVLARPKSERLAQFLSGNLK